jgi:hypothetical protein
MSGHKPTEDDEMQYRTELDAAMDDGAARRKVMHPVVRTRTITKTGCREISTEREAMVRAESVIESPTMMVHTIVYPDGSGSITTHRRAHEEHGWVFDARIEFDERNSTEFVPRRVLMARRPEDTLVAQ